MERSREQSNNNRILENIGKFRPGKRVGGAEIEKEDWLRYFCLLLGGETGGKGTICQPVGQEKEMGREGRHKNDENIKELNKDIG